MNINCLVFTNEKEKKENRAFITRAFPRNLKA